MNNEKILDVFSNLNKKIVSINEKGELICVYDEPQFGNEVEGIFCNIYWIFS